MSVEVNEPTATPSGWSRWWSILLIASLAINLLIGGAVATRFFFRPPPERFVGASYAQLVPRRFLGDLDRARRLELLSVLKQYRKDFSDNRKAAMLASAQLADALEAVPYDQKKVDVAVQGYSATGNQMVASGATAALDFISRLSPDERKMMAQRLRERARVDDRRGSGSGPMMGD
jgi:uncharacterized membrane protein